jgi:metal-responsive CopG/Arc/MetJ family transcriptional regulator
MSSKTDLTIRINQNLLKKVDEIVEKNGDIRSRLIERLLIEYIEQNKNKL